MFVWKKIVKEDPTLHGSWELRRSKVQLLDLIGVMDKKKDITTDIFSQGHKKFLARGREKPLKIFSQGRQNSAENQPLRWSRQSTKEVISAEKGFLR